MKTITDLVTELRGRPITDSQKVAETFKKEHKNVLRDIENLDCSDEFRALNFELSSYKSKQNKKMPEYIMTKDGFTFLVMGYRGKKLQG
ncbi:Rha family transcriptional regulator, partial [Pseudomonas aeruginosa]